MTRTGITDTPDISMTDTQPGTDDSRALLHTTVQLIESQARRDIPAGRLWMGDAQVLARKFYYHLASLHVLTQPVKVGFPEMTVEHIDHGSVLVLVRAALETLLTFTHVYGGSDADRCEFRHLAWKCAGLIDRQDLHASASQAQNRQKLIDEAAQIAALHAAMQAHGCWAQHTDREQRALLKGNWRPGLGWVALGEAAGFHPVQIGDLYSYLCGYSHSSWLSVLQVRDAGTLAQQAAMTASSVSTACTLMSFFARHYVALFPDAQAVLDRDPQAGALLTKWHMHAARVAHKYPKPEPEQQPTEKPVQDRAQG
jgi:hypothetical protein